MSGAEYDSQATYIREVEVVARNRERLVAKELHKAFRRFLERRNVPVIIFRSISGEDLACAIQRYPLILKPVLSACNLGARAVERDLGLKGINTYAPRLSKDSALVLAGYIKPFLPEEIELNALVQIDRVEFIDKEVRAYKGKWEKRVRTHLDAIEPGFKKRAFTVEGEQFEIDAAWPETGEIQIAIDIKRIEAPRDIHKRCDEIVNKAARYKEASPEGRFAAVIYYPFVNQHENVRSRLRSDDIDAVYFAGSTELSIETAMKLLLAEVEGKANDK